MREVLLQSGDVFVMAGCGRMYYHRVSQVLKGTSQLLRRAGRVSLTLRRVSF
jgi:alkylated DNA repair dioxygenase AlkB